LLYALLALVVSWVAYVGYQRYVRDAVRLDFEQVGTLAESPPNSSRTRPNPYVISPPERRDAVKEQAIEQLKEMLNKRAELLNQQNDQLAQKTVEYERLREEADQYLRLLVDVLGQHSTSEGGSGTVPAAGANDRGGTTETELLDLQAELATTKWELEQAQSQLAELELSTLRELEKSTEAVTALVNTGAPAVPALVVLLADQRPELRRWAASILGRMGADAIDAVDDLMRALEDADAEVRQRARAALDQIDDDF
jgi:hypothetical protein